MGCGMSGLHPIGCVSEPDVLSLSVGAVGARGELVLFELLVVRGDRGEMAAAWRWEGGSARAVVGLA